MKDRPDTWSRPRGLDHVVHAVRDLDAAAELYRRIGFQVGRRNRHPWGTHNCIVQLDGFFIEILTVAEPELIPPHTARSFSFGAFNRDFLASGEGLSMVLLASDDARRDAQQFREAGIGDFDVFDFERQGVGPDDRPVNLAFSLAFAADAQSPRVGFATCQHHLPENFWNPSRQFHANGATGVGGATLVADNPTDHHIFLSAFTGVRELQSNSIGVTARTPRGDVEIMEVPSFRDQFGVLMDVDVESARFAGLRLSVRDLDAAEALIRDNNIASCRRGKRLVIAPDKAFGATLIFEQMPAA